MYARGFFGVLDLFRTHVKYITQQVIERAFLLVANRGQFIRKCDKILKAAETHYLLNQPHHFIIPGLNSDPYESRAVSDKSNLINPSAEAGPR